MTSGAIGQKGLYSIAFIGALAAIVVVLTPLVERFVSPLSIPQPEDTAPPLPQPTQKQVSTPDGPRRMSELRQSGMFSPDSSIEQLIFPPMFETNKFQQRTSPQTDSKNAFSFPTPSGGQSTNVNKDERRNPAEPDVVQSRNYPAGRDEAAPQGAPMQGAAAPQWPHPDTRSMRILQIGDSHTAADYFTGELRRALQEQFGNSGVGYIEPGRPHPGLRHSSISIGTSQGWTYTSLQKTGGKGGFFLSGFNATAHKRGETLTFSSESGILWDILEIEAFYGPSEGEVSVSIDGSQILQEKLEAEKSELRVLRMVADKGGSLTMHRLVIETTSEASVTIGSVGLFNLQNGVSVSKVGFPGATIDILNWLDSTMLSEELKRLHPHIVIVAFGTNEGFNDNLDITRWSMNYMEALAKIRTTLPDARIVLIAPPAASRMSKSPCTEPVNLDRVRTKIIEIARQEKLASWDWSSIMPERCGAQAWSTTSPRLMAADLVHLTKTGYELSARQFAEVIAPIVMDIRRNSHAISNN